MLIGGCATTHNPVPEGYTGPVVLLADTSIPENSSKAQFFLAERIDGKYIGNSLHATRSATYGRGFALQSRVIMRDVPIQLMKVELVGTHIFAAPIQEITAKISGSFFDVRGMVDFTPSEGRSYIVTGELKKQKSCIWIADKESNEPATNKICTK